MSSESALNESQVTLTFDTLELSAGTWKTGVDIAGRPWQVMFWDMPNLRELQRDVPAGLASIRERSDGKYFLEVRLQGVVRVDVARHQVLDDLLAAVEAAEAFVWPEIVQAGRTWYCTGDEQWSAIFGEGDLATISKYSGDDAFYVKRQISPRPGVSYELTAHFHDLGDTKTAVRSFAEAAGIATTLPSFLSVLGAGS